jgi:putative phosphoribosyl transferase
VTVIFADRMDAARQLVEALKKYRGKNPYIADQLEGELDVVLVRKLSSPYSEELAVGAIDESGWAYIAPYAASEGADDAYLSLQKHAQLELLRKRRMSYTPGRLPIDAAGRVAIVVDDGLATGATMIAALHAVRAKVPQKLVCAVPVAAPDSVERIRPYADEIVCIQMPVQFRAVGQFYRSFPQVMDDEVIGLLRMQEHPHG